MAISSPSTSQHWSPDAYAANADFHKRGVSKARPCGEAMRLRFADGSRAASSKKMPSVT